jgi:hypothetical protein
MTKATIQLALGESVDVRIGRLVEGLPSTISRSVVVGFFKEFRDLRIADKIKGVVDLLINVKIGDHVKDIGEQQRSIRSCDFRHG